jgi:two-component system, sensor histidine kinase RegB
MRWLAVLGQFLAAVVAFSVYDVKVPWWPISVVLGVTVVSNLLFPRCPKAILRGWSLWLDALLLSVLIFFTGGPHNPFTSFYLLHIALAAMTLPARNLWSLVIACITSYSLLFFQHRPVMIGDMQIASGCESYSWHLQGMLIAFIVTACFIAAFVSRMHRILLEQDEALESARIEAEKNARFASLATLSAGVAHELGSPLATISLASSELLRSATSDIVEDATLIHEQAQRCRMILDQLNERNTFGIGDPCVIVDSAKLFDSAWAKLPESIKMRLKTTTDAQASWRLPLDTTVQAMMILLQNAAQADASGGMMELHIKSHDGGCQIEVMDAGPEPSATVLARASEPFFTTKSPGEGMGLGLFLVNCLAQRLHGEFSMHRMQDHRTCARLLLRSPHASELP